MTRFVDRQDSDREAISAIYRLNRWSHGHAHSFKSTAAFPDEPAMARIRRPKMTSSTVPFDTDSHSAAFGR